MQVTSTEGDSASGQTPNIVWKNFQKKTGAKVKNWQRRKSFPQKIDGPEACFYTSSHFTTPHCIKNSRSRFFFCAKMAILWLVVKPVKVLVTEHFTPRLLGSLAT